MKSVVIIPTYNESVNIAALVNKILALNIVSQILVIDDNSPDGTGEIADKLSLKNECVKVVHREKKSGIGSAYKIGFKHAIVQDFDYIITSDADFSHQPRYIPELIKNMGDHNDLVIGSRYVQGGRIDDWQQYRIGLSMIANALVKKVLDIGINDSTSGFRCYNKRALDSIGLDNIFSDGYAFQIEIAYRIRKKGFKICEVPIEFSGRKDDESKLSYFEIIRALGAIIKLYVEDITC